MQVFNSNFDIFSSLSIRKYTMHNKFSNFLCITSFYAPKGTLGGI